ncbi:hypothetical protein BH623125_13820 [Bartonella henselae]|uniref:hypothetical protein n=1 Tax=Bartonella henselae TaxID=38323 RepID=UPI001579CB9D|nr:hypothetical protein [Bartonella henselae]GFF02948.1 hypothetical protein BH623125_13820 [Bartonella henselae]
MKQTLKLLGVVTLLGIAGCQFNKPPLGEVATWEKNGVTDFTEVGKALLECGMPTPYDRDPENQKLSPNDMVSIDACMVQAGFRYKDEEVARAGGPCYTFRAENLPICRPGAVIPKRSVKKRLNSPFCKKYKNAPECQP